MLLSIVAADRIAIVGLIAKGDGTLTCVFLGVYVIPILTLGTWRILRLPRRARAASATGVRSCRP